MGAEWWLVVVTLLVAVTALLVPYVAELLKRKAFAPKLQVRYQHCPPYCVRTEWRSPANPALREPVYYSRLQIVNTGASRAEHCEAVLEEIHVYDASGTPCKLQEFSSENLHWAGTASPFVHINPRRTLYCDIGHVSSPSYQSREEQVHFVDVPGREGNTLRFLLDEMEYPYSQPNCLAPGKYGLKVVLYSENAPTVDVYLEVNWTGKWQDTQSEMLRELVISSVDRIRGV